jgi:hypothetical protein
MTQSFNAIESNEKLDQCSIHVKHKIQQRSVSHCFLKPVKHVKSCHPCNDDSGALLVSGSPSCLSSLDRFLPAILPGPNTECDLLPIDALCSTLLAALPSSAAAATLATDCVGTPPAARLLTRLVRPKLLLAVALSLPVLMALCKIPLLLLVPVLLWYTWW